MSLVFRAVYLLVGNAAHKFMSLCRQTDMMSMTLYFTAWVTNEN